MVPISSIGFRKAALYANRRDESGPGSVPIGVLATRERPALGVLAVARETTQGKRYQLAEGDLGEQLERTDGIALRTPLEAEGQI